MKISFTSDMHVGYSRSNTLIVDLIVERLKAIKPDVFIICGDISPNLIELRATLSKFANLECTKIFVPGNHDIWIDSKSKLKKGVDSTVKYQELLPKICSETDFKYVVDSPVVLNDIAIAGTMGWYDYSFRNQMFDDTVSHTDYSRGICGDYYWSDKDHVWWLKQPVKKNYYGRKLLERQLDKTICQNMSDVLLNQINYLETLPIVSIIMVMHFMPFSELNYFTNELTKDFFTAYYGSNFIARTIRESKSVSHVFFGHIHEITENIIDNIRTVSSPIGYLNNADEPRLARIVNERLKTINV